MLCINLGFKAWTHFVQISAIKLAGFGRVGWYVGGFVWVSSNLSMEYSKTSLTQTPRGQGNDFKLWISSWMVKLYRKILFDLKFRLCYEVKWVIRVEDELLLYYNFPCSPFQNVNQICHLDQWCLIYVLGILLILSLLLKRE